MKLTIVRKVLLLSCLSMCFLFVTSFYNFISGFPYVSTIKTEKYNARRAEYYEQIQREPEKFQLTTKDNIDIAGMIFYQPKADSVLLICHGYKQSKEHLIALANLFDEYTVVLFDLRAHGDSGGSLVSFGYHEYKDVQAVLDYLRNDSSLHNKKFYGLGISMGAASIANAASRGCSFDGLILDSCFSSIDFDIVSKFVNIPKIFFNVGKFIFNILWRIDIDSIKPGTFLSKISCPLMIIHSKDDKKVSYDHAERLFEAASCQQKSIISCPGDHGRLFRYDSQFYKKIITDFLARV